MLDSNGILNLILCLTHVWLFSLEDYEPCSRAPFRFYLDWIYFFPGRRYLIYITENVNVKFFRASPLGKSKIINSDVLRIKQKAYVGSG